MTSHYGFLIQGSTEFQEQKLQTRRDRSMPTRVSLIILSPWLQLKAASRESRS